ncbi:LacI family transcriptional regulator [Umezawaea tangerina]|uniref:LacI family transcriptional regulator n=2 Tax=Umezawaea tangerina TaxID=84725 RepID=A0A2T0STY9_9PSEU|nr:LacI family transcriptional regulator [Umezawaea tangerina]
MADVALAAGVNKSTVSHVLNGTRIVSDSTRELVLEAISATGYRHNVVARSLATSTTMSLGLAISSAANPYFGDLIRAVEASASAAGYMLMLADTHDDADVERRVVEELLGRRTDGILLAPSVNAIDRALPYLESTGAPTVLIDRFVDAELDQVGSENTDATARLVEHLAEIGHRRIAMVCGLRGLPSTSERVDGFRRTVAALSLDDDPGLELDGGSDAARAEQVVHELFSGPARPSAVVVGNNAMTIGTMRALRRLDLRVPADVALVCYDDFEWADLFEPRLTAMEQDVARIGGIAVDLVVQRIRDPSRPARRQVLDPTFRHRDSCGCHLSGARPA